MARTQREERRRIARDLHDVVLDVHEPAILDLGEEAIQPGGLPVAGLLNPPGRAPVVVGRGAPQIPGRASLQQVLALELKGDKAAKLSIELQREVRASDTQARLCL